MNSEFCVLNANRVGEKEIWLNAWSNSPARDVFAHPEYCSLYADANSQALCAYLKSDDGTVLLPFILRQINPEVESGWQDITTPYGYGGAYISGVRDGGSLLREFWAAFTIWEERNAIVSEVVRCHVVPDMCGDYLGAKDQVSLNVICDVTIPEDVQWMHFEHKVRKNVKKARREGVTVILDENGEHLDDFFKIYYATMERRAATNSYYYARKYFEDIVEKMKGSYIFAHSVYCGGIVSTELVLVSADVIYSFLGGTSENAFGVCPNDLLKYEVLQWARSRGIRYFVLGGGYTPDDGIFRYKRAFAPDGVKPFFVGRRILNKSKYDDLVNRRIRQAEACVAPPINESYFPLYRA